MTEERLSEIEQLLAGWECWLPGNPDFELDHGGAIAACGAIRDLLDEIERLQRECLYLNEEITALRREIKTAQERAYLYRSALLRFGEHSTSCDPDSESGCTCGLVGVIGEGDPDLTDAIQTAVEAEREACLNIALISETNPNLQSEEDIVGWMDCGNEIVDAIRARSHAGKEPKP